MGLVSENPTFAEREPQFDEQPSVLQKLQVPFIKSFAIFHRKMKSYLLGPSDIIQAFQLTILVFIYQSDKVAFAQMASWDPGDCTQEPSTPCVTSASFVGYKETKAWK